MSSDVDCFCCILETLKEEFDRERLALSLSENRSVDWSFATNALRRLTINEGISRLWLLNHELDEPGSSRMRAPSRDAIAEFWKIFEFLMASFDSLKLRNTTLPAALLRHAYYFAQTHEMNFNLTLLQQNYDDPNTYDGPWCLCERTECKDFLLTDAQFRQLLKKPYRVTYPETVAERDQIHKHVVWCAIREGQERLLSGFMKYGVMFLPAPIYVPDKVRYTEILNQLPRLKNYQPPADFHQYAVDLFELKFKPYRENTILRVIEILTLELAERPEPPEPPERQDPPPAGNAEDISTCKSVYFRCLRRAFETIPEPFVSSNEVRKVLRHAYSRILDENLELCISKIIAELEELFPQTAGPFSPRSLKHLSRCQVRENLRQSGTLPEGVKDLGLTTLEKYVTLDQ